MFNIILSGRTQILRIATLFAFCIHTVYWFMRWHYSLIDLNTVMVISISSLLLIVQFYLLIVRRHWLMYIERLAALNMMFALFSHYYISLYSYEGSYKLVLVSSMTQWIYVLFLGVFMLFSLRVALTIAIGMFLLLLFPMIHQFVLGKTIMDTQMLFLLVNLYLTIIFLLPIISGFSALRTLYDETLQRKHQSDSMARTDALTEIANRRALDEQLQESITMAARYQRGFSIAIIDIDFFKQINDRHGHPTGDRVLVKAANIFQDSIRTVDMIGRWGGEEFLLVMPETSAQQAVMLVERLRQEFSIAVHPDVGLVTASAGVAMYRHGDTLEAVIARADAALYQAKAQGRDRIIAH